MSSTTSKLFEPIAIGTVALQHRVVLAPMTRLKSSESHVPILPLVAEFYGQRASKPGSLLVTEATYVAARGGGTAFGPGIWSQEQIAAWKTVTDAVHAKGSFIFMQLWALGRAAEYAQLQSEDPSYPYVSASDVPLTGYAGPLRPLTTTEIKEYVESFAQGAKNAIQAGFDGVEIHSANGYLLDQFLQDVTNKRTDDYGGSIANRARFPLEVVDAVVGAIGVERTAIRFSPWSPFLGMGMSDPLPTYTHIISELVARHPGLAYLHLLEPRISAADPCPAPDGASNDTLRALWAPRPLIRTGGFTRESALEAAQSENTLIGFGRMYISNPDLPDRLQKDTPLSMYNRALFHVPGVDSPLGYTDYGFAAL
ncbi:FMN-linked oxidoreductase [Mycena galopus ATCC 62051]|nr:FMN-linked oxidoreductase [Mycena galopus ATCC 62051]